MAQNVLSITQLTEYIRGRLDDDPFLGQVAVRGEIMVQFWLKPGEAVVTLGPGEEQQEERIPEQLRRFL